MQLINDGTYSNYKNLFKILEMYLVSLGIEGAKQILLIADGAIESLIRQAVNLRLKGNGKFWLKENAEILLHARCQWLSASWNNFTNSILTRRIYPAIS